MARIRRDTALKVKLSGAQARKLSRVLATACGEGILLELRHVDRRGGPPGTGLAKYRRSRSAVT